MGAGLLMYIFAVLHVDGIVLSSVLLSFLRTFV